MNRNQRIQLLAIAAQVAQDTNTGGKRLSDVRTAFTALCEMVEPPAPDCRMSDGTPKLPIFRANQQVRYRVGKSLWAREQVWEIKDDCITVSDTGNVLLFRDYGHLWEVMP